MSRKIMQIEIKIQISIFMGDAGRFLTYFKEILRFKKTEKNRESSKKNQKSMIKIWTKKQEKI